MSKSVMPSIQVKTPEEVLEEIRTNARYNAWISATWISAPPQEPAEDPLSEQYDPLKIIKKRHIDNNE